MTVANGLMGELVIIKVNTGTEAIPVWAAVGGQKNAKITKSTNMADVTTKDDVNERILPGKKKSSLTLDALFVETQVALDKLRDANDNRDQIMVIRSSDGVDKEQAYGYIEDESSSFPDGAPCEASFTIHIDGGWTAI